jgi:acetyl esterase/lipase
MNALSRFTPFAALFTALTLTGSVRAQPAQPEPKAEPNYTRKENVIYGPRAGLALTLDVFTPKEKPNGAGVILFMSAEYRSGREVLTFLRRTTDPFLAHGYVVFTVLHGSQPTFTVPEIVEDAHRAVRFVKHHAKEYGVDPNKLCVAGGSSGGHLSLMVGCAGRPGNPKAADPVERESSRPAAVACFFPPTDFLTLPGCPVEVSAAFDIREPNKDTGRLERVSPERRLQLARELSPINHVAQGAAPTLIIHGDLDKVVPLEQSKKMIAKLKGCEVTCELRVREGKDHRFAEWVVEDLSIMAKWFNTHVRDRK